MTFLKKAFIATIVSISALVLNSCIVAAIAVGGGTVAYIDGNYSMNIEGNYKAVYKATLKAINDNNDFVLVSKDLDQTKQNADIEGATKIDSTSFSVKIERLTDQATKVTIKFGTFGDQAMSSTLMDQIQAAVHKAFQKCNKKLYLIILSTIIAISLNSCVVAAVLIGTAVVAGGTVYYINGNYIIEVPKDIRSVYNATIKTIQMDSQNKLISQTYNTKSATIKALQKGEKLVQI